MFVFPVAVRSAPSPGLRGPWLAELTPAGLCLRRPGGPDLRAAVGRGVARRLGGNRLALRMLGGEVGLAVVRERTDQSRLARDLSAFLNGDGPPPTADAYGLPRWPLLATVLPAGAAVAAVLGAVPAEGREWRFAWAALGAVAALLTAALLRRPAWSAAGRVAGAVAVTALAWGLFAAAAAYAARPRPPHVHPALWRPFRTPDGRVEALLPGEPEPRAQFAGLLTGDFHVVDLPQQSLSFMVGSLKRPDVPPGDVWAEVETVLREALTRSGARVVEDKRFDDLRRLVFDMDTADGERAVLLEVRPLYGQLFVGAVTGPGIRPKWLRDNPFRWEVVKPPFATSLTGALVCWGFDSGDSSWRYSKQYPSGTRGLLRVSTLDFTGNDHFWAYEDLPRLNFAAGAPFTFVLWVKTRQARATLFSQRHTRDAAALIDLTLEDGRPIIAVRGDGAGDAEPAVVRGHRVADDAWHHLAVTRAADGTVELFVDGVSQGRSRTASSGGAITTDLRAVGGELRWLRDGVRPGDRTFRGLLDEFAAFGRRLTDAEVRALAMAR
jgi:hypothetical protein